MTAVVRELKQFETNMKWLDNNYERLSKRYPEEYVAVYNKKVVGHENNLKSLIEEMDRKYPQGSNVVAIKYVTPEKVELILCE